MINNSQLLWCFWWFLHDTSLHNKLKYFFIWLARVGLGCKCHHLPQDNSIWPSKKSYFCIKVWQYDRKWNKKTINGSLVHSRQLYIYLLFFKFTSRWAFFGSLHKDRKSVSLCDACGGGYINGLFSCRDREWISKKGEISPLDFCNIQWKGKPTTHQRGK